MVTGSTKIPCSFVSDRRSFALGALACAGLALRPSASLAGASAGARQPARIEPASLHQELKFNALPARLYDLLLDAKGFSDFTGDAAEVGPLAGQAFSLFGGRITGRNVELVPGERIVQAWRSRSWEAGVYSIVRFTFARRDAGTLLVLDHSGFPPGEAANLARGWHEHYWEPLRKFLA